MPDWLRFVTIAVVALHSLPFLVAFTLDLARLIMWDQSSRSPFTRFLDDHLFRTTCLVLMGACLYLLWGQLASQNPNLGASTALIVPILILALGCQYGQLFFSRLKKLGPLEFFERKAPELLEILGEVFDELSVEMDPRKPVGGEPLPSEKERAVRRADLYLALVEFQSTDALSSYSKRRLGQEIFKVGSMAVKLEDWPMARSRLSWCCRLFTELKEEIPAKVYYNLGMTNFLDSMSRSGPVKEEKQRKALEYFDQAARKDPRDHEAFFWMAYLEDELKMFDAAIRNNQKVLELHHGHAAAKLNIAVSRTKKGELQQALDQLKLISENDEDGLETLKFALGDEELKPLLDHPVWGPQARAFLEPFSTRG